MGKQKTISNLLKIKKKIFKQSVRLSKIEWVIKSIVLQDMPLSFLDVYKTHRRLKVFYHKGVTCCACGVNGVRLIKRLDQMGNIHVDVYTHKLDLMTIDHIIPKSLRGDDSLDNLRPMCELCNNLRQAKMDGHEMELFLGCKIE